EGEWLRPVAVGEQVRDYAIGDMETAIFPYAEAKAVLDPDSHVARWMWPYKTALGNRATFSKLTYFEEGRPWFGWHQVAHGRLSDSRNLTYAFVATHNHFVYDRSGQVGNRTAPVVRLPGDATEQDYLELLGLLNSSTACFWLHQRCSEKGG